MAENLEAETTENTPVEEAYPTPTNVENYDDDEGYYYITRGHRFGQTIGATLVFSVIVISAVTALTLPTIVANNWHVNHGAKTGTDFLLLLIAFASYIVSFWMVNVLVGLVFAHRWEFATIHRVAKILSRLWMVTLGFFFFSIIITKIL